MFTKTFEIEGLDQSLTQNARRKAAVLTVIAALGDDDMLVQDLQVTGDFFDRIVVEASYVPTPPVCGDLHKWNDGAECVAFLVRGDYGQLFCPDVAEHYTGGESDIY